MATAVASRYARAMADAVLAPSSGLPPQAALEQLRAFHGLVTSSHELANALVTPAVTYSRKRSVVGRLGDRLAIHRLARNFLYVLIDHRRIHALGDILEALETEFDTRLGMVRADVSSALALDDNQQATLRERLSRLTGKQVRCRFSTDPALIGGVVARIGSTVYDGSVRGQLEALGAQLADSQ
jgi:F-type H+-transporting ATPase subunit delta